LESLEELILIDGKSSSLHNGWPFIFFGPMTKTLAELVVERPIRPRFYIQLGQQYAEVDWDNLLAKHPLMKPLEEVDLVFVEAERIDPPKLLSDKVIQMREIEKHEQ
jgi:hypothetical protein